MDELQKHYSNLKQTYPQWHDNEVLINADTTVSSTMFGDSNKIYVIDTVINPSSETTFLIGDDSILKFTRNGQFGSNCIIDCATPIEIEAGLHKIFDCRIKAFFKNPFIYPEWWGAVGDGVTDDVVAINKCILAAKRNTVLMGADFYLIKSTSIIINETTTEPERYQGVGLYNPDTTKISELRYQTQPLWEKSRKIIITGNLIGDPSLVGPVVYINGFVRSKLFINTIYVRSTTNGCAGVFIGNSGYNYDIHIQNIEKEQYDWSTGSVVNRRGVGSGIVLGNGFQSSHLTVDRINGFNYGIVLCDAAARPTYVDTSGVGLTNTTTKASHMVSRYDLGVIAAYNPMVWDLRVNSSYINCNTFNIQEISGTGTNTNAGTVFKLNKASLDPEVGGNIINIQAPDSRCTKYFDLTGFNNGIINFHGNVQDISVSGVKVTNQINAENAKIFKFTQCYNVDINSKGNVFLDCFTFIKCSNITIHNAWCSETTVASSSTANQDPQIYYGVTKLAKKPIFDVDVSILEDNLTQQSNISTSATTTTAMILNFRPRWRHQLRYVNDVSEIPSRTTTSNLFYAVTATEYGTTIKVYPLYDSLKRQVGYIYKDVYVPQNNNN